MRTGDLPVRTRRLVAYAAPTVVILAAAVHALVSHRMPLGDDGLIIQRARDVLTADHPWLGTWTSASLQSGVDVNNPLPLHFELLAIMAKPFGVVAGSVLGAALVALIGALVSVRQGELLGGERGRWAASAASTVLAWTIGSELLVEPWQPHNLVLPFLAVLVACASWAGGRSSSAAWAIGLGSTVMGAHLSFSYLVVGLWVVAAVSYVRVCRSESRPWRRPVWPAGIVLVAAWSQAVIEQFAAEGEGNLTRLVRTLGSAAEPIGGALGTRIVAEVVALPPWWLRPSFATSIPATPFSSDGSLRPEGVPNAVVSVCALGAVVLLLVFCVRRARREADRVLGPVSLVALWAVLLSWFTAVRMPVNILGLAPHQARWLWPVAAVATVAIVGSVLSVASSLPWWRASVAADGGLAVLTVIAVWAVVPYQIDQGPSATRGANSAVRDLAAQLDSVELPGPTLFDASTLRFAEPYSGPLFAVLYGNDQPLRIADEGFVRQLGEGRRATGDEQWVLQIREGQAAVDVADGEQIIAGVSGPDGQPVAVVLAPAD